MKFNEDEHEKDSGFVIAPAGCGKTETIIKIIEKYCDSKKILVLTHTNAGVENIEKRIKKEKELSSKCNIYTIASFCSKYVKSFKNISREDGQELFEKIYLEMSSLLDNVHIKHVLKSTYSLMLVDEYQDCSLIQHEIIKKISKFLSYKLFGDPLQNIYNFNDKGVNIKEILNVDFPFLGYMTYPWRWEKKDINLGKWIMESRKKIMQNNFDIFSSLPESVEYLEYSDYTDLKKAAFNLLKYKGRNVILFNIEKQAQSFCKGLGGRFYFQEEAECKILKKIVNYIDSNDKKNIIKEFIFLCSVSFTNFSTLYSNILKKIQKKDFNFSKIHNNREEANLFFELNKGFQFLTIVSLMNKIEENPDIKIYRKELWEVLKILFKRLSDEDNRLAKDVLFDIRNSKILNEKFKYKNLVSRILLVKGLEFENVLLVIPDSISKELLYVAISRPTQHLIIARKKNN